VKRSGLAYRCLPKEVLGFREGRWSLTIESKDLQETDDVEDGVKMLLERLPSHPALWASITGLYKVDLFCGLFLRSSSRGFALPAEVSRMLANHYLDIGFDVYFDLPE